MAKSIEVGEQGNRHNPKRTIEFGDLAYIITKYQRNDVAHVLFKLSYGGKYLIIKGRSLAGALVMFVNDYNSFNPENARFKSHFYVHMYNHLQSGSGGRFRVKILANAEDDGGFYNLLKTEQMELDAARYDICCLNNQMDAYIPQYKESTGMYGWIPRQPVLNFQRWLKSQERKDLLKLYKK